MTVKGGNLVTVITSCDKEAIAKRNISYSQPEFSPMD